MPSKDDFKGLKAEESNINHREAVNDGKLASKNFEKPKTVVNHFKGLLRKDKTNSLRAENSNVTYNFLSKHSRAIKDFSLFAITGSMFGMTAAFTAGVLVNNTDVLNSSLYFAASGVLSAMLLTITSLAERKKLAEPKKM